MTAPFLFSLPLRLDRPVDLDREKKKGKDDETETYCMDLPLCGWSLEIHLCYRLHNYCTAYVKTQSTMLFNMLQYGSSSEPGGGGEADRRGCWETNQWPTRLDYCPGAMVTGTNQYYISMIAVHRYLVSAFLAFCLFLFHTHPHTWVFNDGYLIGKGASRRELAWPGWCVDVQGASKCSWMALMRVANGDIKSEWVHFSLYSDIPLLPPEALERAFGEGATMLQIRFLLPGLIVEDIDLGKEVKKEGGGRDWVKGWGGS